MWETVQGPANLDERAAVGGGDDAAADGHGAAAAQRPPVRPRALRDELAVVLVRVQPLVRRGLHRRVRVRTSRVRESRSDGSSEYAWRQSARSAPAIMYTKRGT